jgi:hypothetical protein
MVPIADTAQSFNSKGVHTQKHWRLILGFVFGLATFTWIFSRMWSAWFARGRAQEHR